MSARVLGLFFLAIGFLLLVAEILIPERRKVKAEWQGRFV